MEEFISRARIEEESAEAKDKDSAEAKDKDGKKSKKKTRAASFASSLLSRHEEDALQKPKETPRWDLLGNLVVSKEEGQGDSAKAGAKAEKPAKGKVKESGRSSDKFEELPEYEPTQGEFSVNGGEVIISFRGARTVIEQQESRPAVSAELPATEAPATSAGEQLTAVATPAAERPMYTQPEQQYQALFGGAQESGPAAGPGSEAGNGNLPPVDPPEGPPPAEGLPYEPPEGPKRRPERTPVDPDRPLEPAEAWRRYMRQQELNRVEIESMATHARKSGVRAFLTGLFTGALAEHGIHRKQQERTEGEDKKNRREVRAARRDLRFSRQEQERRQTESDARFVAAEQRFAGAERRMQDREKQMEQRVRLAEQTANHAEQDALKVAAEHQVQMSAWHAIETDRKTGKVVENPSFAYGREYYRERAQESMPPDQRNAAAGGVAILGAVTPSGGAQYGPTGSAAGQPANVPNATTRQSSRGTDQGLHNDSDNKQSSASIWPWALVLLVVIGLILAFA